MQKEIRVSTGVSWLDDLLGQLRIGENVVWEVDAGANVEAFMRAFLEANIRGGTNAVYVSFNHSPVTMKERLGDLFDEPQFILVDCFTDGKGHSDPVFSRFYDSATEQDLAHVVRVTNPASVEAFTETANAIEGRAGVGAKYVFDSLTGMQDLWAETSRAYRFFTYACPRLYDLKTIAYWVLEKEAHSSSFRANLKHVTQVAVDLSRVEGGYALRLVKAEGRALGAEAEAPHRYQDVRGKLNLVADSRRELLRLGKLIRAARLQRGMSQAELGDLLGVTASTVSQAENGLIALSLPNLFAVARKLELNLATVLDGHEMPKDAVTIMRQKDRPRSRVAGSKRKPVYVERLRDLDLVGDVEPLMVIVPPGAKLNKHFSLRKGTEFGLLLTGRLHVEIAGRTRELQPGDSIYLENDVPSAWSNPAAEEAQLLWVVALR
ncbi:MAG TPA: helix-turn-helix domain-containing protein [Armatimonadota bacterium]|nr:helix-turn-helix domain-containing protein [Armatimonadota bacterium]